MERSIFLAGSGGHGIQMVGKMLVHAVNTDSENATYSPCYGVEKRGGLSSCYLVISDSRIGNPRKKQNDLAVLMDQRSYDQYKNMVKPGGILVINSTMVKASDEEKEAGNRMEIPLMEAARETGNLKVISSVLLGFLAGIPDLVKEPYSLKEYMLTALSKRPELLELNKKAFEKGLELALLKQTRV